MTKVVPRQVEGDTPDGNRSVQEDGSGVTDGYQCDDGEGDGRGKADCIVFPSEFELQ